MWEFFITKSRFTYLVMGALTAAGLYALLAIPRESSPEVQIPIGVVSTVLPGASAIEVEALITSELERGLIGSLDNVVEVTSVSREGVSVVTVEFSARADIDASINKLKDKVDLIKPDLPVDAEDPVVTEVNFVDQPIMTFAVSGDASPRAFLELAEELERRIESLPGISRLEYSGVGERMLSVVVEPTALARYDLSLRDVTSALRSANTAFPIGAIENDGVLYNITFTGKPEAVADIEGVAITTRGGQPVYVRDVATVRDEIKEAPAFSRLSITGAPSADALSFNVYKQRGGDITQITARVNDLLTELSAEGGLLASFKHETILDAGEDIRTDLYNLTTSGIQTVILVVLILMVAIGWREALIAGMGIPLSFLIGFIGLYLSGNTINFLSLFALILGIGILVDSGIVMVEAINKRLKDNPLLDAREAARLAVREFASPLLSGTLTTVAMFVGLFVVTGVIGQFIKSIPFTLIFVLFASAFVALALLPVIAADFLRRRTDTPLEIKQAQYSHRLESWYRRVLTTVVGNQRNERRFLWSIRILLLIALILPVVGLVKVTFFEQADVDFIFVDIELPQGSTKEVTDLAVRRVEEVLYRESDISAYLATIGSGNQFDEDGGGGEHVASIFVLLDKERVRTSSDIILSLRESLRPINDVKIVLSQPNNGPPAEAPVGVTFYGDNLDELATVANRAALILQSVPETTNVRTSIDAGTEFEIILDTDRAASFGLSSEVVSGVLRTAVFGSEATTLAGISTEVPVEVKLNIGNTIGVTTEATNIVTVDALRALTIPTPTGAAVPLSAIAQVYLRESRTVINHENGVRVVSVTSDILPGANARDVQAAFDAALSSTTAAVALAMPASVRQQSGGETEESDQAFSELFLALVVGIVLMVGILVYEFNSFRHMRYVLSILPYSLIGILFGLAITQNALSFPSIMGFIALSGIVVNNSILLIDMMNSERRQNPHRPITDVVVDAAVSRLRPILLTTATTVVGMVPLVYSGDLWAPLAYAVMFGLMFSVLITLVLIPIIYRRKPGDLG